GSLDGHSLRPFLISSGGEWTGPEYSLSATASTVSVKKNLPALAREQHFSIRTEHFRYIRCRNGEEELYDHQKDPNEWVNVAGQSNYFKTLALMRNYFSEATGITLLD
ncbi:MAG: hypothetical protein VXU48_02750, partial [Verrucomicrobiota bacterium]|nr:hypothetical protein [Verrucomicrobiota bacterium]